MVSAPLSERLETTTAEPLARLERFCREVGDALLDVIDAEKDGTKNEAVSKDEAAKYKKELEDAQQAWQGRFELVPSRTSDEAMILIAEDVRRRGRR